MAVEIERKFLVAGDGWRNGCVKSQRLKDGLIAASDGRKVRVRLYEDHATLTVKTITGTSERAEFEYEIPVADAEEMITNYCGAYVLSKTRHYVPFQGFVWEIDVYDGILRGVTIAEVELDSPDARVPLPGWIGREVTYDPNYRKLNMLTQRLCQTEAAE
jgi:adenylate cyclase